MKAEDLLSCALKAALLANIVFCAYKCWNLFQLDDKLVDLDHEQNMDMIEQFIKESTLVMTVEIPNSLRQKHEEFIKPYQSKTEKLLPIICRECIRQATGTCVGKSLEISDICWFIMLDRYKDNDAWIRSRFYPTGQLKPLNIDDPTSIAHHSILNRIKSIVSRHSVLKPPIIKIY